MSTDLAVIEQQLRPLVPRFAEALKGSGVAPERIVRTVLVSIERLPALLDCEPPSILQAAMSAAVLGLEVDGVTGQAFLIPFKRRAQLIIGYRGYATMAGRSGYTVNGDVVREGDPFDFELGSSPYVRHKKLLCAGRDRRIVGAWATATAPNRTPIVSVLDIDELLFVKARSPGARKADSPWNDAAVGFPAMCAKTPRRRLAKDMPLNLFQLGARLDQAFEEEGKPAWIDPGRGVVVDGIAQPVGPAQPPPGERSLALEETPRRFPIRKANGTVYCTTIEEWRGKMLQAIEVIRTDNVERFRDLNGTVLDDLQSDFPNEVRDVAEAFERRLQS